MRSNASLRKRAERRSQTLRSCPPSRRLWHARGVFPFGTLTLCAHSRARGFKFAGHKAHRSHQDRIIVEHPGQVEELAASTSSTTSLIAHLRFVSLGIWMDCTTECRVRLSDGTPDEAILSRDEAAAVFGRQAVGRWFHLPNNWLECGIFCASLYLQVAERLT
jgi:hypothetical protein